MLSKTARGYHSKAVPLEKNKGSPSEHSEPVKSSPGEVEGIYRIGGNLLD